MCKPKSQAGLGIGGVALAAGGVALAVWLAPAALAGVVLLLWAVKAVIVAAGVIGVSYTAWQLRDVVPAIRLPRVAGIARVPAQLAAAARAALPAAEVPAPAVEPVAPVQAVAEVLSVIRAEVA